MKIELKKVFAANSSVDEFDVVQMKRALNRLGYYTPLAQVGITGIADQAVFDALKAFQKDHGLAVTGSLKPNDDTARALDRESVQTLDGNYIWHTTEDEKVRKRHADFNHTIRRWDDAPDPGEDFNCRCWAENIVVPRDLQNSMNVVLERLASFKKNNYQLSARLLEHYLGKSGKTVILMQEDLENSPTIRSSIRRNQKRFEDDFLGKIKIDSKNSFNRIALQLANKKDVLLFDHWDVDLKKTDIEVILDHDFVRAIGSVKIRSDGEFKVTRVENKIIVSGLIIHRMKDHYDFNDDTLVDRIILKNEKELAERGFAKPFDVYWQKQEYFNGVMIVHDDKIQQASFKWSEHSIDND